MNEKLSIQYLADSLSQKTNVSKKVSETFSKAFFDTIIDALYMGESSIKIKGLGVFKLVDVESRESVNVTNGERIVIPGYKKVSFVPDDDIVELLNKETEEDRSEANDDSERQSNAIPAIEEENTLIQNDLLEKPVVEEITEESNEQVDSCSEKPETLSDVVVEKDPVIQNIKQMPVPQYVETPADELSRIDMIISTPESIEDVRAQYESAKSKAEALLEDARKANEEKMRLEKLLERLEANQIPESVENVDSAEISDANSNVQEPSSVQEENQKDNVTDSLYTNTANATSQSAQVLTGQSENDALARILAERDEDDLDEPWYSNSKLWWCVTPIVIVLVGCVYYFMHKTRVSIDSVENVEAAEVVAQIPEKKPSDIIRGHVEAEHPQEQEKVEPVEENVEEPAKPENTKPAEQPAEQSKEKEQKAQKTEKVQEAKPAQPAKPEIPNVYVLKSGESLTRVSQKFYGTKDSVAAIIRLNRFKDPNNVPVGAKIYLP